MTDLSVSLTGHAAPRGESLLNRVAAFFAMVGASVRVARAVEARKQPAAEDLRRLGIKAPLQIAW